jgi:hypothetical protein
MRSAAAERREVWVRGNLRPALGFALAATVVAAAAVVAVVAAAAPPWVVATVAGSGVACLLLAAGCVAAAARPRLVRRGPVIRVCLAPLTSYDLPLDAVECVFPGSSSLAAAAEASPEDAPDDATAGRRVNTLVMRLAERADAWRSRPTLSQWGRWNDGYIVLDGRWCEPLSPAFARDLSQRLLDAKRETGGVAGGPATPHDTGGA